VFRKVRHHFPFLFYFVQVPALVPVLVQGGLPTVCPPLQHPLGTTMLMHLEQSL
jgi:hypothetical protein